MALEQGGIFNVQITCVTWELGFYGLGRRFLRSRASVFTVSGVAQIFEFYMYDKKGYCGPILTRIPTGTETFAN